MFIIRIFALLLLMIMINSCDQSNTELNGLTNPELRKKWRECAYIVAPSYSERRICRRYEKQCEHRKEAGNLACY